MDARAFLECVLSNKGLYCLFAVKGKDRQQYFFDDITKLLSAAEKLDGMGADTYYALATFKTGESRKADNAHQLQSFFIDIDCGEGKPYATRADGWRALKQFKQETGLPRPTVVGSGGGLHVYWPLTAPIAPEDWKPIAERLKMLCAEKGFHADPAVTADVARILRIPGTHNHKEDQPRQVEILGNNVPEAVDLSVIEECVADAAIPAPVVVDHREKLLSEEQAKLHAGKVFKFKNLYDKIRVGKGCPQVEYILRNRATLEEPLWRAGLSLAKVCEDKDKAVVKISETYPGYSKAEAYKKMEETKGPYTCAMFNELNPDVCTECPHKNRKFASPIALAGELLHADTTNEVATTPIEGTLEPETVTFQNTITDIPAYPKPFFRPQNGGVYVEVLNTKADPPVKEQQRIYEYDLYATQWIRDPDEGSSIVVKLHLPNNNEREFPLSLANMTENNELRRKLAKEGIVTNNWSGLKDYLMEWTRKLQKETHEEDARTQFGWDRKGETFAVGDKLIYKGGKVGPNHPSARTSPYFKYFEPTGTLEGWKKAMSAFNNRHSMAHQFVICTGFGSPLMQFMPNVSGSAIHIHSADTGLGKTTAMWAAASIWGNYEDLIAEAKDTKAFMSLRAETLKNLPLYVDELTGTSISPEELETHLHVITQGKNRGRSESSANKERHRGDKWGLITVSTGNLSVAEKISTTKAESRAEVGRILEIRVDDYTELEHDSLDFREFNAGLAENYGHAGVLFMMYVQREREFVENTVRRVYDKIRSLYKLTDQNRYWLAGLTCTIAGGILAKGWGLIDFDMEALLYKFVKKLLKHNRGVLDSAHTTPEEIINAYVGMFYRDFLIVEGTNNKTAKINPVQTPMRTMRGRYEPNTGNLWIVTKLFNQWCIREAGIGPKEAIDALVKKYKCKSAVKKRLNGNTNLAPAMEWCMLLEKAPFLEIEVPDNDDSDEA